MPFYSTLPDLPRLISDPGVKALGSRIRSKPLSAENPYKPINLALRRDLPELLDLETTSCDPVIPRERLIRIRNNVRTQYQLLDIEYRNIESGLNAEPFMASYDKVWDAAEGGSYCHYQNDADVVQEIVNVLDNSNRLYEKSGNLFERNFNTNLQGMRDGMQEFERVVGQAEYDLRPIISGYERFWDTNFQFSLYWGIDPQLDNLMREYDRLTDRSDTRYDQGTEVVQANFERSFVGVRYAYKSLESAHNHWSDVDGFIGFNRFEQIFPNLEKEGLDFGRYWVFDTPKNSQVFQAVKSFYRDVNRWRDGFPEFVLFKNSRGLKRGGGLPEHKFFAESRLLDVLRLIGDEFAQQSSSDESHYEYRNLFITSLSYPHNGKMPPHAEHRSGLDCDLWTRRIDQTKAWFDEERTKDLIVSILTRGVKRVIYTHDGIVTAANADVPNNPVAVPGSGHEDHLHLDVG